MGKKITIYTLIAFVIGIISGIFAPNVMLSLGFLGDMYINLLKLLIIPILFCSIFTSLSKKDCGNMSNIIKKTIIVFIGMFIASFLINYIYVFLLNPGAQFAFVEVEWEGELIALNIGQFISSLIPDNILKAAMNNQILPVILFAFVSGLTTKKLPKKDSIINLIEELGQLFNKLLEYVIYLSPIGVFSLIGITAAKFGVSVFIIAIKYILMAWSGTILITLLVMIIPLWYKCKISPIEYLKKIVNVWLIALSTRSSAATLPTTIKTANEQFNVPEEITDIVVPLGCTIHMCGGAVSFSLLALFNCQMLGISVTPVMFIIMVLSALLLNMGAPGIPGGGIALGATYLSILNIPLNFIGFYAGIYPLLDMAYTTLNVTGDITANCLIKESLE